MIPKFLIADTHLDEDKIYVLHTEYPKFLLEITTEEVEWWDKLEEKEEEENINEIEKLLKEAFDFYDKEMELLEDEE